MERAELGCEDPDGRQLRTGVGEVCFLAVQGNGWQVEDLPTCRYPAEGRMQCSAYHRQQHQMTRSLLLLIAAISFAGSAGYAQSSLTTFIFVRHAEKVNDGTKDPEL